MAAASPAARSRVPTPPKPRHHLKINGVFKKTKDSGTPGVPEGAAATPTRTAKGRGTRSPTARWSRGQTPTGGSGDSSVMARAAHTLPGLGSLGFVTRFRIFTNLRKSSAWSCPGLLHPPTHPVPSSPRSGRVAAWGHPRPGSPVLGASSPEGFEDPSWGQSRWRVPGPGQPWGSPRSPRAQPLAPRRVEAALPGL